MRKYIIAAATLFGMLGLTGVASAEPAFVTGNVNVRTGPGTNYSRIATIQAGSEVEILRCSGNWCQVEIGRLRGWMSANYLDTSQGGYYRPAPPPPPPVYDPRPPYWDRPEYRPPYWDRPGYRPYRPRPPEWDRPGRPDRPGWDRPDRPNRPDRPGRPDWSGPGRPDRPDRPDTPRPPTPQRPQLPAPGNPVIAPVSPPVVGNPRPDDRGTVEQPRVIPLNPQFPLPSGSHDRND